MTNLVMADGVRETFGSIDLAPGSQNWHRFPFSDGQPAFFVSASGPLLADASGRELTDLYCSGGAVILGHADPGQVCAVRSALDNGATVTLRHPAELDLAERLAGASPGASHVAFFKTGSEAVHAAVTTALRATGRRRVLTTSYHGWLMPFENLGPRGGCQVTRLDWLSPAIAADVATQAASAACIVITPTTETPGPDTIRGLVEAARAAGAVVIFDEVKSGFRYAYPTVAASLDIQPDLVVLSKAIGNGFPIAALLGGELLSPDSSYYVYSTYASELISVTAAITCLDALAAGAYQAFARNSAALYTSLQDVGALYDVGVRGVPTFFRLELPARMSADDLCRSLHKRGTLHHPADQVLVTAAHGPAVVDRVSASFEAAFRDQS